MKNETLLLFLFLFPHSALLCCHLLQVACFGKKLSVASLQNSCVVENLLDSSIVVLVVGTCPSKFRFLIDGTLSYSSSSPTLQTPLPRLWRKEPSHTIEDSIHLTVIRRLISHNRIFLFLYCEVS